MICVSAYIVGLFSIALIIYDIVQKDWDNLAPHGLGGAFFTLLFLFLCTILGENITLTVLIIPALFFLTFAFGIWMTRESLRKRGCCVKCTGDESSLSESELEEKKKEKCMEDAKLKAQTIV